MRYALVGLVFLTITHVAAAEQYQESPCKAVALYDVPAVEDPHAILKRGDYLTAVTQYEVLNRSVASDLCDRGTFCFSTHTIESFDVGAGALCAHGDYCYPIRIIKDGRSVEALKLTNCSISKRPMPPLSTRESDRVMTLYEVEPLADFSTGSGASMSAEHEDQAGVAAKHLTGQEWKSVKLYNPPLGSGAYQFMNSAASGVSRCVLDSVRAFGAMFMAAKIPNEPNGWMKFPGFGPDFETWQDADGKNVYEFSMHCAMGYIGALAALQLPEPQRQAFAATESMVDPDIALLRAGIVNPGP